MPLLSAHDLVFAYPHTRRRSAPAIEGLSLTVERGASIGLLGPNGSGKTTLLRLLAGMLVPQSGTVTLDDRRLGLWSRRDLARRIAFVPQETFGTFDYSVLDVVLMGRYPHLGAFALEGADDIAIARDALAATGTSTFEARLFSTLSGGERQRVAIASALAQASDVVLLDEPTASLDLGYQLDIAALLRRLNADRGTTLVVSTHDVNLATSLCREIVLVHRGRCVASGPPERVLTPDNIRHVYGVDADVSLHPRTGRLAVVPVGRSLER